MGEPQIGNQCSPPPAPEETPLTIDGNDLLDNPVNSEQVIPENDSDTEESEILQLDQNLNNGYSNLDPVNQQSLIYQAGITDQQSTTQQVPRNPQLAGLQGKLDPNFPGTVLPKAKIIY